MEINMDFLRDNQELKIIPGEIKGITTGIVKGIYPQYFEVELSNVAEDLLAANSCIEVIISANNCIIRFETGIISIENGIARFSLPEKIRYIQRREYTRVNVNIPVELREFDVPVESICSTVKNLGGGGMKIESDSDFDAGSLLEAKFSIFDNRDIKSLLEVLRVDKDENEQYCLSGQFKQISNADRTAIIQLCFKRQIELNYKGIKQE